LETKEKSKNRSQSFDDTNPNTQNQVKKAKQLNQSVDENTPSTYKRNLIDNLIGSKGNVKP